MSVIVRMRHERYFSQISGIFLRKIGVGCVYLLLNNKMEIKPFTVFLDTSIFEAENFFQGRNLIKLCEFTKNKIVELKITDIIYEELKQRIKSNILKAQISTKKTFQAINGEGKILKNVEDLNVLYTLLNIDFLEVERLLLLKLEEFLKKYDFEIINSNISDINEVFIDYFNITPPFKEGSKKNEFPDAFSLNTIKQWAKKNNEKIFFLTQDSDFLKVSNKNIDITHTISTLLDYITRHTNEIHTTFIENKIEEYDFDYNIEKVLEDENFEQLTQAVEDDIFIYGDYYDPEIGDIEKYYVTIDSKQINSIIQNKSVTFEINASISLDIELSYYDISNAFYDKEDDEWYGKEPKTAIKNYIANIVCLVEFDYNLINDIFDFKQITNFEVNRIEEV